jgi:hypothetical protein
MKVLLPMLLAGYIICLRGQTQTTSPGDVVEQQIRDSLSGIMPGYGHGPNAPAAYEHLSKFIRGGQMTRSDLQGILLKLVEEGVNAPEGEPGRISRRVATGALSALGGLADASSLDRLSVIAESGARELEPDAIRAAVSIANREIPGSLPALTRRLLKTSGDGTIYPMLHELLEYQLPVDETERQRRIALVTEIFREGIRNPASQNRMYLDRVLEKYDPAFRKSEERKSILKKLGASENTEIKNYAEAKMREILSPSSPAPISVATKTAAPPAPAIEKSAPPPAQPESPPFRWNGVYLGAGAATVALLVLIWWKASHRG